MPEQLQIIMFNLTSFAHVGEQIILFFFFFSSFGTPLTFPYIEIN